MSAHPHACTGGTIDKFELINALDKLGKTQDEVRNHGNPSAHPVAALRCLCLLLWRSVPLSQIIRGPYSDYSYPYTYPYSDYSYPCCDYSYPSSDYPYTFLRVYVPFTPRQSKPSALRAH